MRGLRSVACPITLVDRRNRHLFQPLLYQVPTASLSHGEIATPILAIFRGQDGIRVLLGEVTGIDAADKAVLLQHAQVSYNHLIIATGARHSYLGRDD